MIRIRGFRQEDRIVLQVEDDGSGMDEETLTHIFEKHTKDTKSNGVGLKNVNERLQLYYGTEYGLKYESKIGEGTTATVILPAREEGGADAENET